MIEPRTLPAMRCLIIASLSVLLGACASTPVPEPPPQPARAEKTEEAARPPERQIPADALYPLLLAEFALQRQHFDVAMEVFMTNAEILRDPELSLYLTYVSCSLNR